jgi:hypothetical protein
MSIRGEILISRLAGVASRLVAPWRVVISVSIALLVVSILTFSSYTSGSALRLFGLILAIAYVLLTVFYQVRIAREEVKRLGDEFVFYRARHTQALIKELEQIKGG